MMKRGALALMLLLPVAAAAQVTNPGMSRNGANALAPALAAITVAATGCNDVNKFVTGMGTCVTLSAGGAMLKNASNAVLPDALNNLGLGTANTPVFARLSLGNTLYNGVNTLQVDNPAGQVAAASSTYSSDNTSGTGGATIRAYETAFNNNAGTSKTVWNAYDETHVTKQALSVQTFGRESSMYNRGTVATIDPYSTNVSGATTNLRIDCGIGTLAGNITASSSGTTLTITVKNSGSIYNGMVVTGTGIAADTELVRQLTGDPQTGIGTWETTVSNTHASETMTLATDPKGCSSPLHVVNNGAAYQNGIVFATTSVTASSAISAALSMPSDYGFDWYSAAGARSFRMYASGNTFVINDPHTGGNTFFINSDGGLYLGEAGIAGVVIGSATGGQKGDGTLNVAAGGVYDNNIAPTGTAGSGYVRATSPLMVTPKMTGYAVGSLPAGTIGMLAYVTDQVTACPVPGVAPTAGGSFKCPVFYNGSAWVGM